MSVSIERTVDQAFDVAAGIMDAAPAAVIIVASAVAAGGFIKGYMQAGKPLSGELVPQDE